eukprot:Anaeramoba_ignava/c19943_g1_i3.p1 GENE.c19943_g1_i3~~c19943_g1_i3.p1  ORF type:complete len:702 (+),score=184.24 c19943_g1_i3:27-2108(+)
MEKKQKYEELRKKIKRIDSTSFEIEKGFVNGMRVSGVFYVNSELEKLVFDELKRSTTSDGYGGFLPAVQQIANVATLPGIIKSSIGLPDVHSGYGFAIGNVAAFDIDNPDAVVSPGGVGFDINCGVRLIRTNLTEKDIEPVKEELTQSLFNHIPVGVGSKGVIPIDEKKLNEILEIGIDWCLREGYAWPEDKEHCEEFGRMLNASPEKVSQRAKKRGLPQLGTLGAGNHYAEIQVVDKIYDKFAAKKMGLDREGQVAVMIHTGSRGLGHQVATDALVEMEKAMARDNIHVNDRQLACARISSKEGQNYLQAMAAAANYAWVNRQIITFLTRRCFSKIFNASPEDLDMNLIYDVSHNIAKFEKHFVDGKIYNCLVHRKGSTRAFGPHHPLIPIDYQLTGQPVLVGGTMGTSSYLLMGTDDGMNKTFGSTCFHSNTPILTHLGILKISQIFRLSHRGLVFFVPSLNPISLDFEWKPISNLFVRKAPLIKFFLQNKTSDFIKSTPDHHFFSLNSLSPNSSFHPKFSQIQKILKSSKKIFAVSKIPSFFKKSPFDFPPLFYLLGAFFPNFIQNNPSLNILFKNKGKHPKSKKSIINQIKVIFSQIFPKSKTSKQKSQKLFELYQNLDQILCTSNSKSCARFISGVIDTIGTYKANKNYAKITHKNSTFISSILIACLRLGSLPKITRRKKYLIQIKN